MAENHETVAANNLLGTVMRSWRENIRKVGLRQIADELHVHYTHAGRWERGERIPPAEMIPQLDQVYGTGGILVAIHRMATRLDAVSELDTPAAGTLQVDPPIRHNHHGDDDMERRAAMQLLAALGAGAAIPAGSLESLFSGAEHAIAGREGLAVEDWEQTVWEYGFLYAISQPGVLLRRATPAFAEVSRLLGRDQPPRLRRDLLRISAQLGALLGMELSDIGEEAASLRSWQMARRAADASGDRDLAVWVRAREAKVAFWSGRPSIVVSRLTQEAIGIAGGAPSSGLARAFGAQANLQAMQGDAEGARASLTRLADVFEQLPASETSHDASPLSGFPEQRLRWDQAHVSATIGDTGPASTAVSEALKVTPPEYRADVVNLRLVQALADIHNRDVTEGLRDAAALAEQWPLSPTRQRIVGQIITALPEQARTLPVARELRELTAG